MPTPSLLLLPLRRLLSLISSVLGLFPVLLRPPPMAARLTPLALPSLVPRLPTFALRPLAFLPTPSSASRCPAERQPAYFPPRPVDEGWSLPRTRSGDEGLPVTASPRSAVAPSRPHRAPNPAKKHPAQPQEFFGKNSYCARGPRFPRLRQRRRVARPTQRNYPSPLRIPATPSPNRCPMSDFRAVVITDSTRDRGGPSHGLHRTFDRSPDVQTVALADPSDDHRDHWLQESGAPTGYADYRDMLAAESPDIAIIAIHRYHQERLQTFLDTIAAGVKGIVIEKPIASQPAHADQMVAAADAAGARVVLAHRGRENPAVREAKRQAATGKWGPLIQIKARGKGDHRCGVVDALVLGTHELNTMLYFAEANPISCWGTVLINGASARLSDALDDEMYESGPQAGDRIFAEYTFPNGIIGTYESLPIGTGSNSGHALGCDLFFQNAVVTTRSKPDAEIHIYPEGDIFPQAEVGAWQPLLPDGWTPPASDIAAPYWADWPGRESTACSNPVHRR